MAWEIFENKLENAIRFFKKLFRQWWQSLLNIHTGQSCLVGRSYSGVEALWNVVCSRNWACLLPTCYNSYRWRGFNSNRKQLQGKSRHVNFDDIYKASFLPALPNLDLNGTFVWTYGGGWGKRTDLIELKFLLSNHFHLCNLIWCPGSLVFQTITSWRSNGKSLK